MNVTIYRREPCRCFSMLSSPAHSNGLCALYSFGFRCLFVGFLAFRLPAQLEKRLSVRILSGASEINRPMVAIEGQRSFSRSQNSLRKGWIFSFPRFGCSVRIILIMRIISTGQRRTRRLCGARLFGLSASMRPIPVVRCFFQPYRVRRQIGKASSVARSPCFFQNANIMALRFASSVTIRRNRMA